MAKMSQLPVFGTAMIIWFAVVTVLKKKKYPDTRNKRRQLGIYTEYTTDTGFNQAGAVRTE
jgi:hypothetical protein